MHHYFDKTSRIHLVGIKGTGMTALAQVLKENGYTVTGSDVSDTFHTDVILEKLGIRVMEGFNPTNIPPKTELIIHSAAYTPETNLELAEATRMEIPVMKYPAALGAISKQHETIAITGSHGKTTTTALLGTLLNACGLNPTIICGSGMVNFDGMNAHVGTGEAFVVEACEYRRHFLELEPAHVIITNIEAEHLDYFKDLEDVKSAFVELVQKIPDNGMLVINNDDENTRDVAKQTNAHTVTFGIDADADWTAHAVDYANDTMQFTLMHNGEEVIECSIPFPGWHMVYNALACIAFTVSLLEKQNVLPDWEKMRNAISYFRGTARRFERKGTVNRVTIFDDYGHHPTEIQATLRGARLNFPDSRIWVVFMSHTYSRTEALLREFATSFTDADQVIINEVFSSAREKKGAVTGETLAEAIRQNKPETHFIAGFEETAAYLKEHTQPGDIVITMGAGDNWKVGEMLLGEAGDQYSVPESIKLDTDRSSKL